MSRNKASGRKRRLVNRTSRRDAPRWADINKFGLKRARTRRIRTGTRNWRQSRLKV